MGRKKVRKRADNSTTERSKATLASTSDLDFSYTLNYAQNLVNSSWLFWVYIKIILKLVTYILFKTKGQPNDMTPSVKTETVLDSSNGIIQLLKSMLTFFIFSDSLLLEFINPFDVSFVEDICSLCKKD